MAMYQRRRNQNNLRYLIPIISTISTVLLLLLALLSFLAPPPPDNDQFSHHHDHIHSPLLDNNGVFGVNQKLEIEKQQQKQVFRVPIHGGSSSGQDIWSSSLSKFFYGCSNSSQKFAKAEVNTMSNRYLMIATSGGLNQQRTGITDAVVAARILNATLVVPKLDQKSFWKDSSNFTEIFDVDWFISFLSKDVKIIKQLPERRGKAMSFYTMRVPRKCTPSCYVKRVVPVLVKKKAVQLTKFDYRLANKLDTDLQKLRCRVNYHALRFTKPILNMGRQLVQRMRMRSKHFIALHLRFEPDMLAFSGCDYGGGEKEKKELGAIRKRWKTLHSHNPDKNRRQGKCPLTPEEVGLMLRALGFGSDVHIYVASGEVYGGEETLAPLKALFPNYHSKETITRKAELSPFMSFSSRMAALDFIVCDESDVFVTNNNGNMARMLAGRRRYFGHKRTIRPNAKKLYSIFLNRVNMTWEAFASKVRTHQKGFMGEPNEVRPGRGEFHENPSTCICENSEDKAKDDSSSQSHSKVSSIIGKENYSKDSGESAEDDEPDWTDMDYGENQDALQDKELSNITDYTLVKAEEQPELEDMLSD
ncbi:hypothetical protein AQUCO_01500434v1 [Aquilegia coerulea]|uniref:O-fucosyltransferase family protein n=1 Tax=Aquilegia coerulea TaxID=218851 RepID=A0A2G5DTN1_AQUCA|nr:hypothetical protein AQUCO_01500434v1 [Aquilegia coerulea]